MDKKEREKILDMLKDVSTKFESLRDAVCAPYGLSSTQAILILDIYHNPDHTKVTDICKRLNKSTNTISPLINRLCTKGFLKKEQDESDNRIFYIKLTSKSKAITDKISIDIEDYTLPIFEQLKDEDIMTIKKGLELLKRVVE